MKRLSDYRGELSARYVSRKDDSYKRLHFHHTFTFTGFKEDLDAMLTQRKNFNSEPRISQVQPGG